MTDIYEERGSTHSSESAQIAKKVATDILSIDATTNIDERKRLIAELILDTESLMGLKSETLQLIAKTETIEGIIALTILAKRGIS